MPQRAGYSAAASPAFTSRPYSVHVRVARRGRTHAATASAPAVLTGLPWIVRNIPFPPSVRPVCQPGVCGPGAFREWSRLADCCYDHRVLDAPLAQLAEQRTLNPRVRGSSPWRRTRSDLGFYQFQVIFMCPVCPGFLPMLAPCLLGGRMLGPGWLVQFGSIGLDQSEEPVPSPFRGRVTQRDSRRQIVPRPMRHPLSGSPSVMDSARPAEPAARP
jgi:hypothetical protein